MKLENKIGHFIYLMKEEAIIRVENKKAVMNVVSCDWVLCVCGF